MLVLSRRVDESIVIDGGRIEVMIVEIRDDKVRLGISAPRDVPVHRREIHEAIQRERQTDELDWQENQERTGGK